VFSWGFVQACKNDDVCPGGLCVGFRRGQWFFSRKEDSLCIDKSWFRRMLMIVLYLRYCFHKRENREHCDTLPFLKCQFNFVLLPVGCRYTYTWMEKVLDCRCTLVENVRDRLRRSWKMFHRLQMRARVLKWMKWGWH
jgi:hypothetical protein